MILLHQQIRGAIFTVFVLSSISLQGQTKINYRKDRDKIILTSCGKSSPELTAHNIKALEAIHPGLISKGLYQYYYDLGMSYFTGSIAQNPPKDFANAIMCFKECIRLKKKVGNSYYNLAIIYNSQKQYSNAYECLLNYKMYERKKNWDKAEVLGFEKQLLKHLHKNL